MILQENTQQLQPPQGPTPIAFRFRTRFHYEVIFGQLTANPDLTPEMLLAAVNSSTVPRFLPKPWPPEPGNSVVSAERNALLKMKFIVGRASDLGNLSAASMKLQMNRRSPDVQRLDRHNPFIISAEVLLMLDGQITYSIQFPEPMDAPNTLLHEHSGDGNDYVNDTLLLALQQEYEQRGGELFITPKIQP